MATIALDPRSYVESGLTYDGWPSSSQESHFFILPGGGVVPISVESTKAGYVAVDSLVSVWGEGDTPDIAIHDLMRALREHFEDLRSHHGPMSPRLEGQLLLLEHVFRAHGNV